LAQIAQKPSFYKMTVFPVFSYKKVTFDKYFHKNMQGLVKFRCAVTVWQVLNSFGLQTD